MALSVVPQPDDYDTVRVPTIVFFCVDSQRSHTLSFFLYVEPLLLLVIVRVCSSMMVMTKSYCAHKRLGWTHNRAPICTCLSIIRMQLVQALFPIDQVLVALGFIVPIASVTFTFPRTPLFLFPISVRTCIHTVLRTHHDRVRTRQANSSRTVHMANRTHTSRFGVFLVSQIFSAYLAASCCVHKGAAVNVACL